SISVKKSETKTIWQEFIENLKKIDWTNFKRMFAFLKEVDWSTQIPRLIETGKRLVQFIKIVFPRD
ncbi:MAG: hypothetical protein IK063_04005, partial [Clostridia bacterium]|nr:hypothetical protein [Clostridia bacterium]